MKNHFLWPCAILISIAGSCANVAAQEEGQEQAHTQENAARTDEVTGVQPEVSPAEPQDKSLSLSRAELFAKFVPPEDPPLKLGDARPRVKELQATLNTRIGGQTIELIGPIFVGRPVGPRKYAVDEKSKLRLAYSEQRNMAIQIRGDWIPLDQNGEELKFKKDDTRLLEARFFKLPEEPLKVDGVFGQHTQAGVALFQLQQGLPVTGAVDVVTLDKLEPLVPTNPLLAFIMAWIGNPFEKDKDYYPYWAKTGTSVIATFLILLASVVIYQVARMGAQSTRLLSRWLFTPASSPWFNAFRQNKVFLHAAQFAPAIFIYTAALVIFPDPLDEQYENPFPYLNTFQNWQVIVSRIGLAYISLVFTLVAFASINTVDTVCNPSQQTENPISSVVSASKRMVALLGILLVCASLAGRNPLFIVGGLGALTAVFMLVFRDSLLGLVSSVQIIANRVVRVGDWITMPKFNADGDVKEISLTLIKVQNFDKTISTIPTNSVLCESFQNWTGMREAGGRRIKRALLIDIHSIRVCTPEMIKRYESIELIREYIQQKKQELEDYNRNHEVEASPTNRRRLTNIGTFRAYMDRYLHSHPGLSDDMTFLVRHLQPTKHGLPIEIYAFCKETDWSQYEAVQADIFDHILAVMPEFGLLAYQDSTKVNTLVDVDTQSPELVTAFAEVNSLVATANQHLSDNPRTRVTTQVRKLRERIAELELDKLIEVQTQGRVISVQNF